MTAARVIAAMVALACATTARAQAGDEAALERAHQIFVQADADYRLGKFAEAAAGYERAYDVAHAPAILYDIAQANRRLFETSNDVAALRRAYAAYRAFVHDAPDAHERGNAEREVTRLRARLVATETGPPALVLAEKLLAEGDASDAAHLAERRLGETGMTRAELVAALEVSGRARARAGDRKLAVDRFERALTLDPLIALGADGGNVAAEAWAEAQKRLGAHGPLALGERGERNRAGPHVAVRPHDPLRMVARLELHARLAGKADAPEAIEAKPPTSPTADTRLDVPASVVATAPAGARIDCFVIALDDKRNQLATLGSAAAPLEVTLPQAPSKKRVWLWATLGAGAVVVGAAVGLGVYFGTRSTAPAFPVPTQ